MVLSRLIDNFVFIRGFKTSSGSRTDFWLIKHIHTGKKYMLKLFVESQKGLYTKVYERQQHEVKTYESLQKYLIEGENVRNILHYYANGSELFRNLLEFVYQGCKENGNNLTREEIGHNLLQNVRFMLKQIKKKYNVRVDKRPNRELEKFKDYFNPKTFIFSYIITEYITNQVSFSEYLYKYSPNKKQISKYMSVICTTLFQMSQLGINQNDLHFGNILMKMNMNTFEANKYFQKVYLIVFENKTFIVDNQYTPLIYDFDRASIYNDPFEVMKNYTFGGNCIYYDEKRDFVRALCCLYRELVDIQKPSLLEFAKHMIHTLIKDKTYRDIIYDYKPNQENNIGDNPSCHLPTNQTDKANSFQCFPLKNVLVPLPEILSFFFNISEFKSVKTKLLFENNPQAIQTVVKEMNRWGLNKLQPMERRLYITKNIQFVTKCSIKSQEKIIENIYQAF